MGNSTKVCKTRELRIYIDARLICVNVKRALTTTCLFFQYVKTHFLSKIGQQANL